jgi:exo-beta-1,3-glucanase (GH17 family)
MKKYLTFILLISISTFMISCNSSQQSDSTSDEGNITAAEILGNPDYRAISYGGYRETSRDIQPTIPELKEDMEILYAMGIRIIRTYNVHLDHASNVLKAIRELKEEDSDFEMYVMLGAWIDAKNAWTDKPERIRYEDAERNAAEIDRAVELANMYPDIVKIIAVGNEAMVHWATEYYVEPDIILNWVRHLNELRDNGELPSDLWITSSDNFASWGGGDPSYHKDALNELIREVDYISVHTYPMHDTHYNPEFWGVPEDETQLSDIEKIDSAMNRALEYAVSQYNSVVEYMNSIGVQKPVHIGETGWATISNEFYGESGARAVDEYKAGEYHRLIREWSDQNNVSVFYFEAFDEKWKDAANPLGSENHFGLINLESQAKYAIWDLVDEGVFDGLTRDGNPITKTYDGDLDSLMNDVLVPPTAEEISSRSDAE